MVNPHDATRVVTALEQIAATLNHILTELRQIGASQTAIAAKLSALPQGLNKDVALAVGLEAATAAAVEVRG